MMKTENNINQSNTSTGGKMIPISTRISQQDAEFLAALNVEGATTPSEKLREVIAQARKRQESTQDYRSSLLMYQEMLNRVVTMVREAELQYELHSELVSRLTEWLPDMMAYVTSVGNVPHSLLSDEELKKFEEGITDRSFRLMNAILQIGITGTSSCYKDDVVEKHISPVIKLVKVLQQ